MQDVTIFGAGSWGTALAVSLARAGHRVHLWMRRAEQAEEIARTRVNADYLPGVSLPLLVEPTADEVAAASASTLWVFATPSQTVRGVAERVRSYVRPETVVYSAAKGIENETLLTATQVLQQTLPDVPRRRTGVLYGPSHAEEVGAGVVTAIVAAGYDLDVARGVQRTFSSRSLRVYLNEDVIGVEIGGSVKNVLAIAAGMSDGLGGGDNTKAALITRGIAEIRRLGLSMGARANTFAGLAGLGDLIVTCMSQHSRNRYLGEQLGRGRTLGEVQSEMRMVAEGVRTTASAFALAQRYGIEMPITQAVHAILFEGKTCTAALEDLMARTAKHEDWLPEDLQEC